MPTEIVDEVQTPTGGTGTMGEPAPGKPIRISADPNREYVAGGPNLWLAAYLRTLPFPIDDVSLAFGSDQHEREEWDPEIASALNVLKLGALAQGIQVVKAVGPDSEDHPLAEELAAFVKANLDGMKTRVIPWLVSMLDAVSQGNRLSEKIYRQGTSEDAEPFEELSARDVQPLMLHQLKVKPRGAYAFVIDVFTNLVGLLALIPGKGIPVSLMMSFGSTEHVENLLPREKFCLLSYRPKDEDPRGTSILRAGYNAWLVKQKLWGDYTAYLDHYADPPVICKTAPGAIEQPMTDAQGNPIIDGATGQPIMVSAVQAMANAAANLKGNSYMVIPDGSEVDPLTPPGQGEAFQSAFTLCNEEMRKAILGQTLSTGEGKHQSRASSQVHQDVQGLIIQFIKSVVEDMLSGDIVHQLIEINYGTDCLRLAPKISLGDVERQDFAATAMAVAALQKSGYIDDSQYPDLDAMLGFKVRVVDPDQEQEPDSGDPDESDEGDEGSEDEQDQGSQGTEGSDDEG